MNYEQALEKTKSGINMFLTRKYKNTKIQTYYLLCYSEVSKLPFVKAFDNFELFEDDISEYMRDSFDWTTENPFNQ